MAALAAAHGDGLGSSQARAAGRQAVATARKLLRQSWPASAHGDVHALAVAFDTIDADIASDNVAKFENDGTKLNADANVVRAELGLPSIK